MRLFTRQELADYLSLSLPSIDRLISRGEIPVIRIGRSVRIAEEAVAKWLAEVATK